ncbi:DUF4402 domain-containing protein [Catenovulum adriaticum]|uniref:DUF4402 domain-containing protein n=1 Tax=Catenovulum adriaticum TaxID=2984846 RepID=A0ABY7AMP6_9ALTE|nr:DUF4402 domain-containing protein [Catenovulum sp. TS8]WAJ70814.1 DUF4402 domain-containing protein [Catenovulum sp. TS8]
MKIFIFSIFLLPVVCLAQLDMIQPLTFGTIVVGKNDGVSYIEVSPLGTMKAYNHIWIIKSGQNAEFLVSNLPPYKEVNIQVDTLTTTTSTQINDTEQFLVDTVTILPSPITTDSTGKAKIYIGAVLKTTGNNKIYLNTEYTANFRITLNY